MTATTSSKATARNTSLMSDQTPLLSAAQLQPSYSVVEGEEEGEDDVDRDRDFLPIEPLPTPRKKPTDTTMPSQTTQELEFAEAVKIKEMHNRRNSCPPAPGLRPISVGPMASKHPPERPQNERLNKVFQELALKDLEEKAAAKAAAAKARQENE